VELDGKVADDLLDISAVDRHLCTTEGLDLLTDPGDEGELGTSGLLVTSVHTDVSIGALVLLEVLADGLKGITLTLGSNNDVVGGLALIAEDDPGGLGLVGDDVFVSLLDFGVLEVCHVDFGVWFERSEKGGKLQKKRKKSLKKKREIIRKVWICFWMTWFLTGRDIEQG